MGREGRDYWVEQLSEYWDSGLTIQEYSELKELPYESTRRWIRVLEKVRQDGVIGSASLELVEVAPLIAGSGNTSGIRLQVNPRLAERAVLNFQNQSVTMELGAAVTGALKEFANRERLRFGHCPLRKP